MSGTTRLASAVKTFSKSANANLPVLQSPKCAKKLLSPAGGGGGGSGSISQVRTAVTTGTGSYHHEPLKVPMGVPAVLGTISAGLLIGAGISKNIASFLEENELFVPSDDDDDD